MSTISNVRVVTGTSGCSRVTFLAENLTTGIAKIFSIKMSVPDKGITFNVGTLKGRVKETAYQTSCEGEGFGLTSGVTTFNERDLSMTFADDYNHLNDIDPTIARNIVLAVFTGGTFDYAGDRWAVIGTNGTRNIGRKRNNLDFKNLFLKDGEVIVPDMTTVDGIAKTETNNFVTALKDNNFIMVEFIYAFNDDNIKGSRMVYVLGSDYNFNEGSGTDFNKYEVTASRYSDVMHVDKYFIQGLTKPSKLSPTDTSLLTRVEVDIIYETATGGVPTATASDGATAISINTATGEIVGYVYESNDWEESTNKFTQGTLFYSTVVSNDLSKIAPDGIAEKSVYVAVKNYNLDTKKYFGTSAKTGTGPGTETFIYECMDWIYEDMTFANYLEE